LLFIYLLNERLFHLIRPVFIVWNCLKPFEQFAVCTERVFWTLNRLVPTEVHYMKNAGMFSSKTSISFQLKKDMDILDDMGVSQLSAKVFFFFFFKSELLL